MVRNQSLDSLQLQGFQEVQPGQWTLHNDGHSSNPPPPLPLLSLSLSISVCLIWVSFCCQSSWRSAAGCQWAAEASRMFITPSSCTSTGGVRPPTALSTPWMAADTRWRYSSVSRGRRFHWPAAAASAAASAGNYGRDLQGFLLLGLFRCTSSTWRQCIPTWLRRWTTRRAWQCWESSLMSVHTCLFLTLEFLFFLVKNIHTAFLVFLLYRLFMRRMCTLHIFHKSCLLWPTEVGVDSKLNSTCLI